MTVKPCCERAELTALLQHCGSIRQDGNAMTLDAGTENAAIARRMYTLMKSLYGLPMEVIVQKKMRLKKNNVYIVRLRNDPMGLLQALSIATPAYGDAQDSIARNVPFSALQSACCRKSFLRGAFLASGSVNDPDSHSYHLELMSRSAEHAQGLLTLLREFHLHAKMIARKSAHVVYIKEGEKIVEFLGVVGAYQALLHFEDVRVVKEMRNQVNRLVNCETANLNKTILAAVRQLDNIRLIEQEVGLATLPDKLRIVAEKRLQLPEITLQELSDALPDRVSKSGLNHRLRKLDEIAQKIRADRGIHE